MRRTRGTNRTFPSLRAVLLVGTVWITGCAATGPAPEMKDPAKGEFYTPEEVLRLRGAQADAYCTYMNTTYNQFKAEEARYKVMTDSLTAASDSLRNAAIEISSRVVKLQQEVRELRLKEKALNSYVVKPGDTLQGIAKSVLGDAARWKELFDANRSTLGDAAAPLTAGTRLSLPIKDKSKAN